MGLRNIYKYNVVAVLPCYLSAFGVNLIRRLTDTALRVLFISNFLF